MREQVDIANFLVCQKVLGFHRLLPLSFFRVWKKQILSPKEDDEKAIIIVWRRRRR
jgi:hypothetical protein